MEHRVSELYTTGVPSQFIVEYQALVERCDHVERALHEKLKPRRHNERREFFRVTVEEVVHLIRVIGTPVSETLFHKSEQDIRRETDRAAAEDKRALEEKRRLADEMQRRKIEAERNAMLAQERAANWKYSLAVATDEIRKRRTKYFWNHADGMSWGYYILTVALTTLPGLWRPGLFPFLIVANSISILPFFLMHAYSRGKEEAELVYHEGVIQKVASFHLHGNSYEGYLTEVLQDAIRRKKVRAA